MTAQTVKLNLDTREFDRGISRVTAALGAIVGIATIRKAAQLADEFQQVNARLKLATGGAEAFTRAQRRLNALAAETRSGLSETTDLFSRLARSTAEAGTSQEKLLVVTETINKAIKVSGASAQEANAAIIQLGQGLASGALRGDELRSVLEQTPRLAQAIAAGLGITIGELRKLGSENKLTTQVVLDALENQAPKIRAEFEKIPPTIQDAFTELNNQILRSTETLNKAGFGALLSGLAKGFGDTLDSISQSVKAVLPEKDLADLSTRIRIKFNETAIGILRGVQMITPALGKIFDTVKIGVNNLVRFFNALPPEMQTMGIIGYMLVGRGVKIIISAVVILAKEIARIIDATIKPLADMMDFFITKINAAKKSMEWMGADQTMIETFNYAGDEVQKMVEGLGITKGLFDEQGQKIEEIGDAHSKNNSIIEASIKSLEITNRVLAQGNRQYDDRITRMLKIAEAEKKGKGGSILPTGPSQEELDKIAKANAKRLKDIQDSLLTEIEAEKAAHDEKLRFLQEYYKGRTQFDTEYRRITQALEEKHQNKMKELTKRSNDNIVQTILNGTFKTKDLEGKSAEERIDIAKGVGKEVLGVMAQQNKKAFELQKALAVAQALLDAKSIIMSFAKFGATFGPIGAALGVAAGVAFTAAQIAAIQSQQYQGRKYGGTVQKGQPYIVGEGGKSEMFVPNQTGTIIPNNKLGASGPVNVNFNIQALDSTDVDTILLNRRGMITGIIREAMEENGMRSLV